MNGQIVVRHGGLPQVQVTGEATIGRPVGGLMEASRTADLGAGTAQEDSRRPLTLAAAGGLSAVAVYATATIIGAALHPGYSHVRDAISELTASQAVNRVPLAVLYVAYNLLLIGFGWGLRKATKETRLTGAAFALMIVTSACGIAQVTAFPQDSTGTPATVAGTAHIGLAGVTAVLCVVVALLYGIAFRRLHLARPLWVPAFAVAAFLLVAGPVAAGNVGGPAMGLFERLPIGRVPRLGRRHLRRSGLSPREPENARHRQGRQAMTTNGPRTDESAIPRASSASRSGTSSLRASSSRPRRSPARPLIRSGGCRHRFPVRSVGRTSRTTRRVGAAPF